MIITWKHHLYAEVNCLGSNFDCPLETVFLTLNNRWDTLIWWQLPQALQTYMLHHSHTEHVRTSVLHPANSKEHGFEILVLRKEVSEQTAHTESRWWSIPCPLQPACMGVKPQQCRRATEGWRLQEVNVGHPWGRIWRRRCQRDDFGCANDMGTMPEVRDWTLEWYDIGTTTHSTEIEIAVDSEIPDDRLVQTQKLGS